MARAAGNRRSRMYFDCTIMLLLPRGPADKTVEELDHC